jgi:hypothetical protein
MAGLTILQLGAGNRGCDFSGPAVSSHTKEMCEMTLTGYRVVMQRIAAIRDRAIRCETAEDFVLEIAGLDGVLNLSAFLQACRADQPGAWPQPDKHPVRV